MSSEPAAFCVRPPGAVQSPPCFSLFTRMKITPFAKSIRMLLLAAALLCICVQAQDAPSPASGSPVTAQISTSAATGLIVTAAITTPGKLLHGQPATLYVGCLTENGTILFKPFTPLRAAVSKRQACKCSRPLRDRPATMRFRRSPQCVCVFLYCSYTDTGMVDRGT